MTENAAHDAGNEASAATTDDTAELSYEEAREQLVATAQRLEAGNLTLEESLRLWERGEALADRCQAWLDGARERLDAKQAARSQQAESDG